MECLLKERRYITSLGYRTSLYINEVCILDFGFEGSATGTVEIVTIWFKLRKHGVTIHYQ